MLLALIIAMAADGPISKFDGRKVETEYDSAAKSEDVERCLLDLRGMTLPQVYRQPDRPDAVRMLWQSHGPMSATVANRVDLTKTPTGTHVKGWFSEDDLRKCAP